MTPTAILRSLVQIPSVSSMPNAPLLDAIERLLSPLGWKMMRSEYVAADGLSKANLVAVPERFVPLLPAMDLLFVCHTDTVPYKAEWTGATVLSESDGLLQGCGSCDVKGSMAGLLAAALAVPVSEMSTSVGFAFTAEEEIGCIGASKLVASGLVHPRKVIVCEPTSLRPATAGKGYGLAEVIVHGQEAHSAFPAKGVSAINTAAAFISRLEERQGSFRLTQDERFLPPHTTFNVGVLHGGSAKNIVAGECRFLVEWRPLPSEDPTRGGDQLKALAAELMSERVASEVEVKVTRADAGFGSGAGSAMGRALQNLLQRRETGISFGSEATRFSPLAEEVVVVGPGDMQTAHSERECVPIAELEEWTRAVQYLLRHGLQSEPASTNART